jgi:branched-chain amino acid transport system ATP-binding protein
VTAEDRGAPLVELTGLFAGRAGVAVVRELSLSVRRGEVLALAGPNGAGKSTTMLTIAGALAPISGGLRILDGEATTAHAVAKRGLSFVPEDRGIFQQLTVRENLRLRSRPRKQSMDDVLDLFPHLTPRMALKAGLLSGGEQQMLALAGALVSRPRVLLVDEMSLGLAPLIVAELLRLVRRVADETGLAVLLVEQHVHAVMHIADHVVLLGHGDVKFDGPASAIRDDPTVLADAYLGTAASSVKSDPCEGTLSLPSQVTGVRSSHS